MAERQQLARSWPLRLAIAYPKAALRALQSSQFINSLEADIGDLLPQHKAVIADQAPIADKDRKVFVSKAYITSAR